MTTDIIEHLHECSMVSKDLYRKKIMELKDYVEQFEQTDVPAVHHFSKGVYVREMMIPKDTVVIGKIHKTGHVISVNGDCAFATENGVLRIQGHKTYISQPGEQRLVRTFEDTWFTTIHPTDETDVEKLEDMLSCKSYEEFEKYMLENPDLQKLEHGGSQ